MKPLLHVFEERRGSLAVARLHGEIDASNTEWLGGRLRALLSNRSNALAVDLSETTYLDSAGIALLFALASELRLHQQQLLLVVPEGSPIARMLELTGLGASVPIHRDVDAAAGRVAPPCEPLP